MPGTKQMLWIAVISIAAVIIAKRIPVVQTFVGGAKAVDPAGEMDV